MIKRIAVFTFFLVYLSTTVGFALSLHFCGTRVSGIRVNHSSAKPCCSKEKEAKPDKCCNDKHIKIKVSDQQQTIQQAKIPAISNLDLLITGRNILYTSCTAATPVSQLSYRGPPVISATPLIIQNRVFRI